MTQKHLVWIIGLFSVLYIITLIYFSLQVNSLRQQIIVTPTPAVATPSPTIIPSLTPTIPVPPTSSPRPSSIITLKYFLPSGWSEVKLDNSLVSIGYDPAIYLISQNDSNGLIIQDNSKKYYADIIVTEKKYDGGSRHVLLSKIIGGDLVSDRLSNYHEKEFKIGNSTCLFLIGFQPSQSLPTWGVCPISNTKAILINIHSTDDAVIEKILKTVKFTGDVSSTLTYQNNAYKFSFQHSNLFSIQESLSGTKSPDGNTVLASFSNNNGKTIEIVVDHSPITLDSLKKYAPTGQEGFPPNQSIEFTSPQFYYYGPGGGGVCYPDIYFTGNSSYTLIFRFIGCDNDKTPPQYIKDIEHQILKSFRFN